MPCREVLDKAQELKSQLEDALCKLCEAHDLVKAQLSFWDATDRMEELRRLVDAEVALQLEAKIAEGIRYDELLGLRYILSLGDECGFTKACCAVRAEIAKRDAA